LQWQLALKLTWLGCGAGLHGLRVGIAFVQDQQQNGQGYEGPERLVAHSLPAPHVQGSDCNCQNLICFMFYVSRFYQVFSWRERITALYEFTSPSQWGKNRKPLGQVPQTLANSVTHTLAHSYMCVFFLALKFHF